MGNRAMVVFTDENEQEISPAVYLHWDGSPVSIYAFLAELKRRRAAGHSVGYSAARFIHVVGDFFDQKEVSSLSLGVEPPPPAIDLESMTPLANEADDNGVYVVRPNGDDWHVRRFKLPSYSADTPVELSPRRVSTERKAALKENRFAAITEFFKELRPTVSAFG